MQEDENHPKDKTAEGELHPTEGRLAVIGSTRREFIVQIGGGVAGIVALKLLQEELVHRLISSWHMAAGQLAVFQGASEAPISESYGSSEQRGKTANWPRPGGLR
jgi:hypothetical protein